ncbi:MAG TPA: DUF397 domain-containing protein [Actinopolymorphaceae bacterium]|jgi:hypothetical protein
MEDKSAVATHPFKGDFDLKRAEWRSAGPDAEIQVGFVDDLIGMRSAKNPDGPILIFTAAEWEAFLSGAKDGEFDPDVLQSDIDPAGSA